MHSGSEAIEGLHYRELDSSPPALQLLAAFYERLYVAEFPDADERESLDSIQDYLRRKDAGWYGDNNYHVVVTCAGDRPVAGVIFDFLADAEAGVVEFLVVDRAWRGRGLGSALLEYTERALAADAEARGRHRPPWLLAEMNDPFWPDPVADSLDPFERAAIWGRWGFHRLVFPYVQPALAADKRPVPHLMLAIKFLAAGIADVSGLTVTRILREYLRWAMRIAEPERSPEFRAMADYLRAMPAVRTLALTVYVVRDPERPLDVRPVESDTDPDLGDVLDVYRRAFSPGPATADPEVFRRAVRGAGRHADVRYHLWAVRRAGDGPVEGMASFFTFPEGGFGGYVALLGSLRGSGRSRLLMARIEQQMIRDRLGARGWYVECQPDSVAARLFAHLGFHELALPYRQPPLDATGQAPPLRLMYKEFGARGPAPRLHADIVGAALRRIASVVYHLEGASLDAWTASVTAPKR